MGGGAGGQRGDLAGGPRLVQRAQQPATPSGSSRLAWAAARVASARDLAGGPRRAQRVQQLGHAVRVVEAGVGGGAGGQRGDLAGGPRLVQRVQQLGHAGRSSRLTWAAGSRSSSAVTWPVAPASRSAPSRLATAYGSSRLAWAAAQSAGRWSPGCRVCSNRTRRTPAWESPWALACLYRRAASRSRPRSSAAAPRAGQVGRVSVAGRGRPEGCRRDHLAAGTAAVLVEIVGQLPGRPAAGAGRGTGGGAGPDGCQRPADPLAGLAV